MTRNGHNMWKECLKKTNFETVVSIKTQAPEKSDTKTVTATGKKRNP
jgi:hypothetical protein